MGASRVPAMRASTGADEWGIAIAPGGDAEAPRPACAPPIVAQGGRAHIGGYWHRSITEILVVTRVVLGAFFAAQYGILTYVLDNGYRGDSACVQKMHEDTARISLFSLGMEAVTMLALSVILLGSCTIMEKPAQEPPAETVQAKPTNQIPEEKLGRV